VEQRIAAAAEHCVEVWQGEPQRAPANLERSEMARVENRAVAQRERVRDVLDAADREPSAVAAIGGEPGERDLGDRHAHRLEIALDQAFAVARRHAREADLEVAVRDLPVPACKRVHSATVDPVNGQRPRERQRRGEPHPYYEAPSGPVAWPPKTE